MHTPRIRAAHVSKAIIGVMGVSVAVFTAEFVRVLSSVFGQMDSAASFFGSADAMMYLTIECLFLMAVLVGAFFVARKL